MIKKGMYVVMIILFLAMTLYDAGADELVVDKMTEEITGKEQEEDGKKEKSGIVPIALPFYMPETSFGIGFYILYYNNPDAKNPGIKPNEYSLYGTYTLKNQASVGISTERYFLGSDFKLNGALEFSKFPDLFWGVGPDTRDDDEEDFNTIMVNLRVSFMYRVWKYLYLGPAYDYKYEDMWEREDDGLLRQGDIPGSDGTYSSGIGINALLDTRDHSFYPKKGFLIDFKGLIYRKEVANEYNFSELIIDARYFIGIHGDHVIALQGQAELREGTVPFEAMTRLGGDIMLRGYYQGRYRDKNFAAAQAEYRYPIYWRFAGVLFASAGQVAPNLRELAEHELKIAWGLGLRLIADREEHIAFRLDAGFDRDMNPNFYFLIKEAF